MHSSVHVIERQHSLIDVHRGCVCLGDLSVDACVQGSQTVYPIKPLSTIQAWLQLNSITTRTVVVQIVVIFIIIIIITIIIIVKLTDKSVGQHTHPKSAFSHARRRPVLCHPPVVNRCVIYISSHVVSST